MAEPEVPPDNNAAERSLRHLVVSRKVSGGTRSDRGTATKMTLASIFGTWRAPVSTPSTPAVNYSSLNRGVKHAIGAGECRTTWVMPDGHGLAGGVGGLALTGGPALARR